ncbi:MAG: DUF3054 domain-containing protein [Acidimicrobiia bacterium]|nr:DUF3054 domain-containing protein [Acidimicrobiia bacterium]
MNRFSSTQKAVISGDIAVLIMLTLAGFATHLTLDAFGRMIVTMVASLLAWAAVSPFLGVYREEVLADPRSLWRVGWAAVLAAPLATFLRAVALDRDIPWVFVLVTMGTTAVGLLAWRIAYGWWMARQAPAATSSTISPR